MQTKLPVILGQIYKVEGNILGRGSSKCKGLKVRQGEVGSVICE